LTFKYAVRRKLADLIREHGARGACDISTVPVSVGTLLKIAHEFDVPLKKGRRPRKAA
jgi:hypothetical protein